MGVIESKVFKSGNSVAVRLPKDIAFAPDTPVTIERTGNVITIRPTDDPAEGKRRVMALVAALRALPAPGVLEERVPIEFPERPGLY